MPVAVPRDVNVIDVIDETQVVPLDVPSFVRGGVLLECELLGARNPSYNTSSTLVSAAPYGMTAVMIVRIPPFDVGEIVEQNADVPVIVIVTHSIQAPEEVVNPLTIGSVVPEEW